MNPEPTCPVCRRPLPAHAPGGLCPECLIRGGLGTNAEIDLAATDRSAGRQNPRFVPPSVEEIADVFPNLEVLEFIGQGGMGAVYKARQKQLDRLVALKILPPGIGDEEAFAERFAREAKAMAKLNHPGIVAIHDFGQVEGLFYFVMEFVDGVNLGELARTQSVSPREALRIVPQVCDALQYAHDQGIVHRDIKPENILLDRKGRVKVADFGLAKLVGSVEEPVGDSVSGSGPPTLTTADKVMGTPQYMAPEQKERPLDVDHRADVYSLGVVFYQLLTGDLPERPIEPPSRRVQIDVRLDEVVLRALEEQPERRYQQVSTMKTQVEAITTTPGGVSPGQVSTQGRAMGLRHVPWQIWIVVAYLVIEGIVGNLPAIPHNPVAATWIAAKSLFVFGLIYRWKWVFVLFLLEAALHAYAFSTVAPLVALMNLALFVLTASAWPFYFPKVSHSRSESAATDPREDRWYSASDALIPVLIGIVVFASWLALSAYRSRLLIPVDATTGQPTQFDANATGYPVQLQGPSQQNANGDDESPSGSSQQKRPISYYAYLKLENRGMEEGVDDPDAWVKGAAIPGVEYLWDQTTGHNSQSSLCLYKTTNRCFPIAQWSQTVPWDGDHPALHVGVQVKALEVTKAIVDVIFLDREGKWISHEWVSYIGAKDLSDPPVTHDWKDYSGQVSIPEGCEHIQIALQIYGPGKVWFDDVRAVPVSNYMSQVEAKPADSDPAADVADIPYQDLTVAGNDRMRYFLIGPRTTSDPPEKGYKLVVALPGGDGGENFTPFVRRILKHALSDEYLVAQPIAFKWDETQVLTWPTRSFTTEGQEFSTEDFVEAVVRDVSGRYPLDNRYLFTLSWSSGGPAGYAVSLAEDTPITGSYVAMSIFKPELEPPLENAKGRVYFIDHSTEDRVCPFFMAEKAEKMLREQGATVRLNTYQGGHGWQGDVYGRIRGGIQWLEGVAVVEK